MGLGKTRARAIVGGLLATTLLATLSHHSNKVPVPDKAFTQITGSAPIIPPKNCSDAMADSLHLWVSGADTVLIPYRRHRDGGPVRPTPLLQDTTSLESALAKMDSLDSDTARIERIKAIYQPSDSSDLSEFLEKYHMDSQEHQVIVSARQVYENQIRGTNSDSAKLLIARQIIRGNPRALHVDGKGDEPSTFLVNSASPNHYVSTTRHEEVHSLEGEIRKKLNIGNSEGRSLVFAEALATYLSKKYTLKTESPNTPDEEIARQIMTNLILSSARPVNDTITRSDYSVMTRYYLAPAVLAALEWRTGSESLAVTQFAKRVPCF